jgi:hypothetical protein
MAATQHDKNMVAAQHGSSTKLGTNIIGHRQQHNGQGRDMRQQQPWENPMHYH